MATKKLGAALLALATPTFGAQVTMPSIKLGATAVTATAVELNYSVGVTSGIQAQLNTKLASSSYTAADVLAKLITVDGTGSAIDADLLDGQHGSYYAPVAAPVFTTSFGFVATGWRLVANGTKLEFQYNGTAMVSFTSAGLVTAANDVVDFGTP